MYHNLMTKKFTPTKIIMQYIIIRKLKEYKK